MKELEITIQLRNNRLKERRDNLKLSRRELSRLAGLNESEYGRLEALKTSPISKGRGKSRIGEGAWKVTVLELSRFYKCNPAELFPDALLRVKESEVSVKSDVEDAAVAFTIMAASEQLALPPDVVLEVRERNRRLLEAVGTLTKREQEAVNARFGFDGENTRLTECGKRVSRIEGFDKKPLSGTRVSQIVNFALRKLRHPTRSRPLKEIL